MSTLQLINWLVGLAAFAVLLPFLDRIRAMTWRTHLWSVVGMHVGMAVWLGFVAFHGLYLRDLSDLRDIAGVLAAACWIRVSRQTWRHGPPEHTETKPLPFDPVPHR